MNETANARVLVKDGKWQVPVHQRPANWQKILPETVVLVAPVQLDLLRCCCGRPLLGHPLGCGWRAFHARLSGAHKRAAMSELRTALDRWAEDAGCGTELSWAIKVCAFGMFTRKPAKLARAVGCPVSYATQVATCARQFAIWQPDGAVFLGCDEDDPPEHQFVGLLLVAMAAAGQLDMFWDDDGKAMFQAKRTS